MTSEDDSFYKEHIPEWKKENYLKLHGVNVNNNQQDMFL